MKKVKIKILQSPGCAYAVALFRAKKKRRCESGERALAEMGHRILDRYWNGDWCAVTIETEGLSK